MTGDDSSYGETQRAGRREALRESLAADVDRVVELLLRVCEGNRRSRDFTRSELRDAVVELCVHAPAYRSYVRPGVAPAATDGRFIDTMLADARASRPDLDDGIFAFLEALLLGDLPGDAEDGFVARFQQLTGPVAAKGEEDTAFYRWMPLLCLNDVGLEPDRAVVSVADFHERCARRQRRWPMTMLTTSTHVTKRGEDVRARVAVLSEMPDEWIAAVQRWRSANGSYRDTELDAPDARDEWFIYQTLAGAHPLTIDRAWPVIEKSLRETKRRTSWLRPSEPYERATRAFLESIIEPGRINSLAQTTLRLLCPGVPDTYQGTELWDSNLVDPDNRRAVDYAERERALSEVEGSSAAELWAFDRERGRPKLALLRACLAVRRRHAEAFGRDGSYTPVEVSGPGAARIIAFARGDAVVAVVPRLSRSGVPDEATVALPEGDWTNVLTGETHAGDIAFAKLRAGFPVAILESTVDFAASVSEGDLEPVR